MAIKNVIYLKENMRFSDDVEWGKELAQARRGIWTDGMKAILANRLNENIKDGFIGFRNKFTQVISSDNAMRKTVNMQILKVIAQTTRVFKVPARIGPPEKLDASVFQLLDNKTQGLPTVGFFYTGMQVRMKTNQCLEKGVANGMFGIIQHIEWPRDTDFSKTDNNGFCCPSQEPTNIFVDIPKAPKLYKNTPFPGLENTHWPSTVMPIHRERKSFRWKNNSMHITQFPIVPAFATTCYGAQGSTYDSVCVASLRPPHYRSPDRHSLYVALSRVRRSDSLILTHKIEDADYEYFRPSEATLAEDRRLLRLHDSTLKSIQAHINTT